MAASSESNSKKRLSPSTRSITTPSNSMGSRKRSYPASGQLQRGREKKKEESSSSRLPLPSRLIDQVCPICFEEFPASECVAFREHILVEHLEKSAFYCSKCEEKKGYSTIEELRAHFGDDTHEDADGRGEEATALAGREKFKSEIDALVDLENE